MDRSLSAFSKSLPVILSVVQVVIAGLLFNFHHGWIDDVYYMACIKGDVMHVGTTSFFYYFNNLTSPLLYKLYQSFSAVNWFGWLFFIYTLISVILFNTLLHRHFHKKENTSIYIALSFTFFFAILLECVQLQNATRTGVLLTGLSVILIIDHFSEKRKSIGVLIFLIIVFVLGFNIRNAVSALLIPLFSLYFVCFRFRSRSSLVATVMVTITILSSLFVISKLFTDEEKNAMTFRKHLVNIVDGFNGQSPDEILSSGDREFYIKGKAVYYWFLADFEHITDEDFLNKLGPKSPFASKSFKQHLRSFNDEVYKARKFYSKEYCNSLNWYWKSIMIILLSLVIPLLFFFRTGWRHIFPHYVFILGCVGTLAFITLFWKMEDRVLNPYLILILMITIVESIRTAKTHSQSIKTPLFLVILLLTIIVFFRLPAYKNIQETKKEEVLIKRNIMSELQTHFADKNVIFDLYSCTILHDFALNSVKVSEKWFSYIEIWNMSSKNYLSFLDDKVGCHDVPCFFESIASKSDDYMFYFLKDRIDLIEEYLKTIYNIDIQFTEIENENINKLQFSFFWMPLELGLYQITDYTILPNE